MGVPFYRFRYSLSHHLDIEEQFSFFVPAQIVEKANPKTGKVRRVIQGIASTSDKDLQGETVEQLGIDYSYFTKHGYFNDDHKPGNENRVGEPNDVKLTKNGLFVKGIMYEGPGKERADAIWNHMNALDSNGSSRRMGFSIEGKIVRRAGTNVRKCWLQNIAVTAAPVNTKTWAEIVKSLAANKPLNTSDEDEEKALAVGGGHPIVPESLDRKKKNTYSPVQKGLEFYAVAFLVKSETPGLSDEGAIDVAKVLFAALSH